MSLQFLSTQSSSSIVPVVKGGGGGKGKKKAGGGDWASIVSSRENSLFIFHALGKVLYNKRTSSLSSPPSDCEKADGLRLCSVHRLGGFRFG